MNNKIICMLMVLVMGMTWRLSWAGQGVESIYKSADDYLYLYHTVTNYGSLIKGRIMGPEKETAYRSLRFENSSETKYKGERKHVQRDVTVYPPPINLREICFPSYVIRHSRKIIEENEK